MYTYIYMCVYIFVYTYMFCFVFSLYMQTPYLIDFEHSAVDATYLIPVSGNCFIIVKSQRTLWDRKTECEAVKIINHQSTKQKNLDQYLTYFRVEKINTGET